MYPPGKHLAERKSHIVAVERAGGGRYKRKDQRSPPAAPALSLTATMWWASPTDFLWGAQPSGWGAPPSSSGSTLFHYPHLPAGVSPRGDGGGTRSRVEDVTGRAVCVSL